jgi:hypothetical protein
MALIEYRIIVDKNGQARVQQDVQEIGPQDKIQFVADPGNTQDTYIQFDTASPFANPGSAPITILVPKLPQDVTQARQPLQVRDAAGNQVPVPQPLTNPTANAGNAALQARFNQTFQEKRRAYHFQCGHLVGGVFTPWGGPGSNNPDGGSEN